MGWLVVVGGYLLGSILPAEWVVLRRTGRTPHQLNDNPGGAGAWRLAGPGWGTVVALFDLAKGAVSVALAERLGLSGGWLAAAAVAPVAGHNWPFYKGFRGGRGLAAATGALFWLALPQMLPAYGIGAAAALWRRWVPMVGVVAFPVGLVLMVRASVPADRVQAAFLVMLVVAVRQLPWVWERIKAPGRSHLAC
ncbi:MAG: glycerol-3-phosphate acyltransferase [Bacillota bacterium]